MVCKVEMEKMRGMQNCLFECVVGFGLVWFSPKTHNTRKILLDRRWRESHMQEISF